MRNIFYLFFLVTNLIYSQHTFDVNSQSVDINTNFFSKAYSNKLKKKYNSFDLITANNVFAHSPHLYDFSQGVKNLLSRKGVFVIEVSYLQKGMKLS